MVVYAVTTDNYRDLTHAGEKFVDGSSILLYRAECERTGQHRNVCRGSDGTGNRRTCYGTEEIVNTCKAVVLVS